MQLMLYTEPMSLYSEILAKFACKLYGQKVEFLKLNLLIHIVTTGL
jgi:hypothetical protein